MDVIDYIRNQRYLKALIQILLTSRERMLLLRLRQIDISKDVEWVEKTQSQKFESERFSSFKRRGVDKASLEYLNQFFKSPDIVNLVRDLKNNEATQKEMDLLSYLGL